MQEQKSEKLSKKFLFRMSRLLFFSCFSKKEGNDPHYLYLRGEEGSFRNACHDGLHFLQAGACHGQGIAFPIFAVEQFQR
jgi:hypothetical protein